MYRRRIRVRDQMTPARSTDVSTTLELQYKSHDDIERYKILLYLDLDAIK